MSLVKKHKKVPRGITMINPRGKIHIIGMRRAILTDLYYFLINRSWFFLGAMTSSIYLAINAFFGYLYWLDPEALGNAREGSYWDAFFFSVQTIGTIGYGYVYPKSPWANTLVTFESLHGLIGFALMTGMAFAKFSRPRARVIFSRNMVVTRHDGKLTLMFRVANERANYIADATISITLAKQRVLAEGRSFTQMIDMQLVRHRSPMFFLTWTVMHEIDHQSPLYKLTKEDLESVSSSFICSLTGFDSSLGQVIHARHSYAAKDVLWDSHLTDILRSDPDGNGTIIDYHLFHETGADVA